MSRQFFRHFLAETFALGGHQDDRHILSDYRNGLEGPVDRLDLHHHAAAAAVRRVVGHVMPVFRMTPDVVQVNGNEPAIRGLLQKAATAGRCEHLGENGQNIEPDHDSFKALSAA